MSNDYFNYGVLLPAGIARAGDVDSRFQAVETAFGYLPSRATLGLVIKPIVTAGGTANALTVTNATPLASYTEGQRITFKASASNTTAATINADGLGAKAIKRADGTTVSAGDIVSGTIYDVVYNSGGSGYFQFVAATVGELATYAASASASATAATTGATTATTKAGEASTSAAAALVSQNAAAASASAASTSASGASTSASSASSSASSASTSASTATTKAGEAATSATNAATSETNAGTSAATATTKAGQAATSATNAATSETNAASSASTASAAAATIPSPVGHSGSYLASDGSSTWIWSTPTGVLPSQTGNSGKYLTTNGTSSSWASLGTIATQSAALVAITGGSVTGITDITVADGGTGSSTASGARTNLGLVIGTDVQAQNANLAAMAGVTSAADKLFYFTGSGTGAVTTLSAFARTFLDDADAATVRTTLGAAASSTALTALGSVTPAIGKAPYFDSSTTATTYDITAAGRSLVGQNDVAAMRTALGLVLGTDVQAYDAELAALAGLVSAANKLPYFTGSGAAALADLTVFARTLLDDADAATMRSTLGAQASDAELTALAGLTSAANALPYFTGSGTAATTTLSSFIRTLLDDADAATARATLGVSAGWTLASSNTGSYSNASPLVVSGLGSANDILIAYSAMTFPNAGNPIVGISDTGSSYATATAVTGTNTTDTYSGATILLNARADTGSMTTSIAVTTAGNKTMATGLNGFAGWRLDGGISYVTVFLSGSFTFNATVKVYTR